MTQRKILIRCDAGDKTGGGHLVRCLAFANGLKEKNCDVYFFCNEQAWEFPSLENSGFAKVTEDELLHHHFAYGIVDHYGLDAEYERFLKPYCDRILVIDDLANRPHECDMLVDFSPSRKAEDYKNLVPQPCKLFIGLDYFILRKEFFERQEHKKNDGRKNIFLTMGSIDGTENLPPVLDYLERYEPVLNIHVLMTSKTKTLERVKSLAAHSHHHVTLHVDIPSPAPLMKAADLAITAGGMTCLELVASGVPTLAMIVADNQIENVGYLNAHGYIKHIHDIQTLNTMNLDELLNAPQFTKLEKGQSLKIISQMF